MEAIIGFITGLLTPGPAEEMRLALLVLVAVCAIFLLVSAISTLAKVICLIRRSNGFSGPLLVMIYLTTAVLLSLTFLAGSVYSAA